MRKISLRRICIIAMGIALYAAVSICLQVPVFENYYLCLGYVVMMVYCYSFGITAGTIVGVAGCVLHCLLISGLRGMPGWAVGNLFIGLAMGLTFRATRSLKKAHIAILIQAVVAVAAAAVAMLLIKSGVESILYAQPLMIRMAKNLYAFAADAFMMVISLPLCPFIHRVSGKMNF